MKEFFQWADSGWRATLLIIIIGNLLLGWFVTFVALINGDDVHFGIWMFGHLPAILCAQVLLIGFFARDKE